MCLWGTLVALIAATPGLEGWRTRVAILVVGVALIAARLISAFYLLPFGAMLVLAFVPAQRLLARPWRRGLAWLVLMVATWTFAFGLIVASTLELFSSYYLRGHVMAGESTVRRLATGLNTLRDDLVYYPVVLHQDHLGRPFEYLALARWSSHWRPGLSIDASEELRSGTGPRALLSPRTEDAWPGSLASAP